MSKDKYICHETENEYECSPEVRGKIGYDGIYTPSSENYRYDDRPEFIKEMNDLISRVDINKFKSRDSH